MKSNTDAEGIAAGLYCHVPFCRTKCIYCDFYSTTQGSLMDSWLATVEREMHLRKSEGSGVFARFDSLYIGGGTPTLLGAPRLARLFAMLRANFSFSDDTEITVEANPDDATNELLESLRSLGVNRLSFGIQSFDDRELAFLKRRHDAAAAAAAVHAARRAGFTNIGLDLIYGIPGQTKRSWLATLERAVSLAPQHLSCYQLTVEGKTPLALAARRGKVRLASEEKERTLFLATSRFLEAHGFIHYEVSNFAASEGSVCRHNEKYWRHVPYLGLGPSAHSFDGSHRWWNAKSVKHYCEALDAGKEPVEEREALTPEQLGLERCYLGMRTSRGVALADLPESSAPAVKQLRKSRIARIVGDRLVPTVRGFLVADSLPVLLNY